MPTPTTAFIEAEIGSTPYLISTAQIVRAVPKGDGNELTFSDGVSLDVSVPFADLGKLFGGEGA